MGRNQDALRLLDAARRLFRRLDAHVDLVYVEGKEAELETTYLEVVREWGQSIESADTYTFGHCERVARRAVAVAEAMGMDEHAQTTVRVGAYLHDVGKVRVPHEILNKPDKLTPDEIEVVQMHPVWGIELLAAVEFPWDIKPIIRWHHERYDGSGYPDRLKGDEIPVSAQIVGIADVYDALTTTRPYRPALTRERALTEMERCRGWWAEPVRRPTPSWRGRDERDRDARSCSRTFRSHPRACRSSDPIYAPARPARSARCSARTRRSHAATRARSARKTAANCCCRRDRS